MDTICVWTDLIRQLFLYSKSHKRIGSVIEFLFLEEGEVFFNGTTNFDVWLECARSALFPFCYSTTIVHEYIVTVDFSVVYKGVSKLLGKPFIVVPKRK